MFTLPLPASLEVGKAWCALLKFLCHSRGAGTWATTQLPGISLSLLLQSNVHHLFCLPFSYNVVFFCNKEENSLL